MPLVTAFRYCKFAQKMVQVFQNFLSDFRTTDTLYRETRESQPYRALFSVQTVAAVKKDDNRTLKSLNREKEAKSFKMQGVN